MIQGAVDSQLQAIIRLHIADVNGQTQAMEFKVDTGFTDFISLPPSLVKSLGLPLESYEYIQIGDGRVVRVPVHKGVVIWEGKPRYVDFHALGTSKLIGMALLAGHSLAIHVTDGGNVTIALGP